MLTAVWVVARGATTLGDRRVHVFSGHLDCYLSVTATAENSRSLAQQRCHPRRVRVMAGSAFSSLHRSMRDEDSLEIVTGKTGFLLIDDVGRR